MTYGEAVQYIEDIPKFTKKTTLDHTDRLLEVLGHPEKNLQIIHVAGTNGKGSTCAYLDSCLRSAGYRTGLFTSPHIVSINDRFRISGEIVGDDVFLEAFEKVMEAVRVTTEEGDTHPTYFETLFLMGILIFRKAGVDYVILETGMGGRLDATNVIKAPLACIITSISLDHTAYLGTTIREIAGEKAGIIKAGVPVIYDGHDAAAAEVIRGKAEAMGSPSFCLKPEVYRAVKVDSTGTAFDYRMPDGEIVRLKIPQIAEYQMMNASLAYFTLRVLSDRIRIGGKNLEEGLLHMYWPCRMETVADRVVIDGAHNADGVAEFVKTVQHFRTEGEITLLFSAVADKRYAAMIGELVEGIRPEHVVTTKISGSREVSEDRLAQLFRDAGCADVRSYPTPGEAYEAALGIRGTGWLFCVGSLYLAGELKKYIAK